MKKLGLWMLLAIGLIAISCSLTPPTATVTVVLEWTQSSTWGSDHYITNTSAWYVAGVLQDNWNSGSPTAANLVFNTQVTTNQASLSATFEVESGDSSLYYIWPYFDENGNGSYDSGEMAALTFDSTGFLGTDTYGSLEDTVTNTVYYE